MKDKAKEQAYGMLSIRKKLILSSRGETITETLVAVLIMALVSIVFSVSVVTAAKINNRAGRLLTATHMDTIAEELSTSNDKVTIYKCSDKSSEKAAVSGAKTENGHAGVVLTTEKHEDTEHSIEDKFYFYAIR